MSVGADDATDIARVAGGFLPGFVSHSWVSLASMLALDIFQGFRGDFRANASENPLVAKLALPCVRLSGFNFGENRFALCSSWQTGTVVALRGMSVPDFRVLRLVLNLADKSTKATLEQP